MLASFIPAEVSAGYFCTVTADGYAAPFLTDDNIYTYKTVHSIEVESSQPLFGIYIKYDRLPGSFTVTADGALLPPDTTDYLHRYIALNGVKKLVFSYEGGASVADLFAFSDKETPSWVQKWEPPGKADVLVCPTHSDDDQLYFAGLIPWCAANGYRVQIVYFTNHLNTHDRPHELLEGLWHCGVKCYPIISDFPDLYSAGIKNARAVFGAYGYDDNDFISFYLDVFRRCEPLVVVSHDFNGEYGHGAHMLNADVLVRAIELSAEKGLWNVPKTYVHLWEGNASVFDWDKPLEAFGGKSAFNISQEGFEFHKSQHRFESLTRWLYGSAGFHIDKASQIKSYSPCRFGLYRSTVGPDTGENPLFQNIRTYRDDETERALLKKHACFFGAERRQCLLDGACPSGFYLPCISAANKIPPDDTSTEEVQLTSSVTDKQHSKNGREINFGIFLIIAAAAVAAAAFIIVSKRKNVMKKDRKRLKSILRYIGRFFSVIGITLLALLLTVYCTGLVITHGPSIKARELLVQTLNETSAAKWVPKLFLSGSAIDRILSSEGRDPKIPEPIDPGLIVFPSPETSTPAEYEEHSVFVPDQAPDFEVNENDIVAKEDGLVIVEVNGGSYHGYMMIVKDPSRVFVATLDSYGPDAKGISLSGFMKKYDAVAGVNAGGFYDPNGSGNGGIPDGLVIGNSEILWGGEDTEYNCVIGFDKNNVLHVGTFSGREALKKEIVSAVSFAPGPVLIVNGQPLNEDRPLKGGLNPRTAIGQRADGAVLLLAVDGRQPQSLGASYDDLVDIMLQFNAVNAANLDGGSSTRMHYRDRYINECASVIGQRGLPDVILVRKGEQ